MSRDPAVDLRLRVVAELNELVCWAYFYCAFRDYRTGEAGACGWPPYEGETATARALANLERLHLPRWERPQVLDDGRRSLLIDDLLRALEPFGFLASTEPLSGDEPPAPGEHRAYPQHYHTCSREEARRHMDLAYEIDGPWDSGPEPFHARIDAWFASFQDPGVVFITPAERITDSVIDVGVFAWEPAWLRLGMLCYQNDQ